MTLNYFAYGSNMSLARMSQRVPSANSMGRAMLERHQLCFHKAGKDGSAKCDAFLTGHSSHRVFGVLYTIDSDHKAVLDTVEGVGRGYEEKTVTIVDTNGMLRSAFTYFATHIDDSLIPYSWYLEHVLIGAREAELPEDYIAKLASITSIEDQDFQRSRNELSIHVTDGNHLR